VEEGWGWLFVAVEHWNAECMGWHVCKQGTRFAALEPISQGLMTTVGSVAADAVKGRLILHNNGLKNVSTLGEHYMSDLLDQRGRGDDHGGPEGDHTPGVFSEPQIDAGECQGFPHGRTTIRKASKISGSRDSDLRIRGASMSPREPSAPRWRLSNSAAENVN
jgi:hypothetical protein